MAKSVADLVREGRVIVVTNPEINAAFTKAFQICATQLRKQTAERRASEMGELKGIKKRCYRQFQYNPSRTSHFYSPSKLEDYSLLEPNISNILFL